jgi:Flp pilus assembly pilin Flp
MAKLRDWLAHLTGERPLPERGQGLMEYGLIISVVSIAAVVLIMAMGPRVASMFSSAGTSFSSDRRRKGGFAAVNSREVLARVVGLPVQTWNYLAQGSAVRHIGPMAQDFHNAIGVGEDDTHIAAVDANGVALAAIQGLHEIVQDQNLKAQSVEARLTALEAQHTGPQGRREAALIR